MKPHACTGPDCFGCHIKTIQLRPTTAFQPHYNYSVGHYVNSEREFRDILNREADHNSLYTGTEHNYEMRDPSELGSTAPFPDSDDILNTQGREIASKYAGS